MCEKIIRSTYFRLGILTILQLPEKGFLLTWPASFANLLEYLQKKAFTWEKKVWFPQGWFSWPPFRVLEHQNGRRVVMVSNSQHGLLARKQSLRIIIFLLSVQNSALGTIISFKIMGISLCLHHQLRTFHSSFTPHPLRIKDFWIRLQRSQQNLDRSGLKVQIKKLILQPSFSKDTNKNLRIQIPAMFTGGEGRGRGVQKNNKHTLWK